MKPAITAQGGGVDPGSEVMDELVRSGVPFDPDPSLLIVPPGLAIFIMS